ncbi:MAG: spore germination protein [Clostridiales bacterium]|nr:spore germination protein [Clostridiales bacterium]
MKRADILLEKFTTPDLIVRREFSGEKLRGVMLYNPDLTDTLIIQQLLKTIESTKGKVENVDEFLTRFVVIAESEIANSQQKALDGILNGDTVVIIDGVKGFVIANTRKYDKRAISEPPTSNVMLGPREGFVEDVKTNLTLIERRLRTTNLAIEKFRVGRESGTCVAIVYLSNIADSKVVKKIRERIKGIDIDGIIDSNYVRAFIEERPMSVFSQSAVSEKPDVVCAKMLEGRVAVIVDGSPMVLTFPFLLIEDFQSGEDYYQRSAFSTFLRIVRFLGVMTAIFLPGLYVALQIFHYNIIPMRFVLTLMSSVSGIPFKPLSETVFVILLFELIREAGIRTPRAVGMAMSIVGALVLGETAVKAGIISSPAVMIVALSSLSLYTVPNQVGTMSILRIVFTLLGGAGGLYLIICGATFIALYLTSIDSFGTPYLAPFAPLNLDDMKDSIARVSLPRMKHRPSSLPNVNDRRQK